MDPIAFKEAVTGLPGRKVRPDEYQVAGRQGNESSG
jgi:hypothetical protein